MRSLHRTVAASGLAALALVAPAAAETLSRREAVVLALRFNPSAGQAEENLRIFEGRKQEALADALPELTLYGSWNRYRDPALLNSSSFDSFPPELRDSLRPVPANLYEGVAELRQTLFSFKVGAAIRGAREAERMSQEDLRAARSALALEAVFSYNDYLLARAKVEVARKSVTQKQRHLEMASNRRAAGVATDLEVLRARVDVENERATLEALIGAAELRLGSLNAVMLRPIDAPVEPSDSLALVPFEVSLEQALQEALVSRPEMLSAAHSEKAFDAVVQAANAEKLPSLDLFGSYGWSVREPSNFLGDDFSKWSIGVTLKVPVFDGFRTKGRLVQARAERSKVGHQKTAIENRIRIEAKDAVDRLRVATRVLAAAELNVSQAQQALDMTEANYRHGAATNLDVLDAQASLTQAESIRIQGLHQHANARAQLRYVMARDPLDPEPKAPVPPGAGDTTTGDDR